MSKQIVVRSIDEIEPLLDQVRKAAERTAKALAELPTAGLDGIEILRRLKFTEMAWHPIELEQPLNLIEQVNQTWTVLVSLKALPLLFDLHGDAGGFRLNLGAPHWH